MRENAHIRYIESPARDEQKAAKISRCSAPDGQSKEAGKSYIICGLDVM